MKTQSGGRTVREKPSLYLKRCWNKAAAPKLIFLGIFPGIPLKLDGVPSRSR